MARLFERAAGGVGRVVEPCAGFFGRAFERLAGFCARVVEVFARALERPFRLLVPAASSGQCQRQRNETSDEPHGQSLDLVDRTPNAHGAPAWILPREHPMPW